MTKKNNNNDSFQKALKDANADLYELLGKTTIEDSRNSIFDYLSKIERQTFDLTCSLHPLEITIIRTCVSNFRNVIGPSNEKKSATSALTNLWNIAHGKDHNADQAFVNECEAFFKGITGRSGIYRQDRPVEENETPEFIQLKGRQAALKRTERLDILGSEVKSHFKRYPSGLEPEIIEKREKNRDRILSLLGGTKDDWSNYKWHLDKVITKPEILFDLIELESEFKEAMEKASKNHLPVGMTPYYVSLMDYEAKSDVDFAIRAQVLPPPEYVDALADHHSDRGDAFDFMGEHDTSPIDLITRRYPGICILKPFNTCSQICVYCQRNWEIDECMDPDAMASQDSVCEAIDWLKDHPAIREVLITGGDPIVLDDDQLAEILDQVSGIEHVERIRIGSRTPVVLPSRWTDSLADLLASYHKPGRREVAVVTHFEHPYEITPEACEAVQKIRARSIGVYNQEVFTIFNSRRFETAKLRKDLRLIGVDPYYTFNMKGKEETTRYRVPIARILQERKEEARLLPGMDRTDEAVFNVPRLGKNHLRASNHRQLIGLREDGARVYEFHPWERNIDPLPTYVFTDVPLQSYLDRIEELGESAEDYSSLWYYY